MRMVVVALLGACVWLVPAGAEAQTSSASSVGTNDAAGHRTELALGPHLIRREHSSDVHVGGGLAAALGSGRAAGVIEAGGTRRDGHNDWRILAGGRAALFEATRTRVFVQGLVGTLIRSGAADIALMPGVGLDVGVAGRRAIRLQVDLPVERSEARTATGLRVSIWLVFSPLGR